MTESSGDETSSPESDEEPTETPDTDADSSRETSDDLADDSSGAESTEELADESSDLEGADGSTDESSEVDAAGDDDGSGRFTLDMLPTFGPAARARWGDRAVVMGLAALVLIPLLGAFGLWDPWETHYGEVARQITERNDWISTWWGSHWEDAQGQTVGSYFYSKPILLMWSMAIGLEIFGFSEWGIRLGVCLLAIVVLGAVYTVGASVFRRRTGYLMAAVLGTSPFFFFLSRQAQTDMPFVGLMTIGLCFFMMGAFGEDRNEPADKLTYGLTFGAFGLLALPQVWLVFVGLSKWRGWADNPVMAGLSGPSLSGLAPAIIPLLFGIALLIVWGAITLWLLELFDDAPDRDGGPMMWPSWVTLVASTLLALPQVWLVVVGIARATDSSPQQIVEGPMAGRAIGLIAGGLPLILGAVLLVGGLWVGRRETNRARTVRRRMAWSALAATWIPLLILLGGVLIGSAAPLRDLNGWFVWGATQAAIYGSCFAGAVYLAVAYPIRERRRLYLMAFYVFIGLATLSKGLLGFLLPGCVLFFYILLTREWNLLKRVELLPGLLAFVAVCFPWYAGMLVRHTHGFWQRFFVHDHFKRLANGVHQIDTGSFEHFIRWLGYGLYPWSALIPASLAQFFTGRGLRIDDDRSRARLMLLLWATIAFTLFTLSSTKFHHYIFPTVPPLALLVALAIDDAFDREVPEPWPLYLLGVGIFAVVAWDLIHDPQTLKDLFTYKYERDWDGESWNTGFRIWLTVLAVPGFLGLIWFLTKNRVIRRVAFGMIFACGVGMAIFSLDVYMPEISSTWSQKGVWDAYYSHCDRLDVPEDRTRRRQYCAETGRWNICEYYDDKKRYCEQDAIAYKLKWRGETYYTQNEVIPIRDDQDWDSFIDRRDEEPFYGIMQRGRYHGGFKRGLPSQIKGKSCIIYEKNIKFILIKVPCNRADKERARELFGDDAPDYEDLEE